MGAYETSIYHAILITAIVLGCVIVYFAVSVFRQQRKYIRLQRQYFTDEINLLEKDRTRIARDLHDEVGPLLSLTKSHIAELEGTDEKENVHIGKATEHLQRVMVRMGEISVNLAPNLLVRKGLRFTLEKFIEDLGDVNKLQTELLYQVKTEIGAEKAIHLYRIIQEISHNTLKHAKAKKLLIHLKEKHGKLYLLCRDDGRGFNALEVNENRTGLGLGSLQSRTVMLEGKMRFKSKPKYGTEYFFEFPLSNR